MTHILSTFYFILSLSFITIHFNHKSINPYMQASYVNLKFVNLNLNDMKPTQTKEDQVRVVVRVRPPLARELKQGLFMSTVEVDESNTKLKLFEYHNYEGLGPEDFEHYMDNPNNYRVNCFTFDRVYDDESTQQQVYTQTARLSVCSALEGYNATIMAYGQTGTGKTYTMEGFRYNMRDEQRGIIPRAVEDIFKYIQSCDDEQTTFMVRASYLQIYNEVISDLLRGEKTNLKIREDPKKGVFVQGVSEWAVVKPEEIMELMKIGGKARATAKTNMNESSSRSHAVFIITIEQMKQTEQDDNGKELKVAKLNLVDLAGSENVRVSGAEGKQFQQCKNINSSLSCLGNVISALVKGTYIPYRDSILTRLLSDSLGGNCKTTMMTMISPALQAFRESLSSLRFASGAKNIKNKPVVNEDVDQRALIRKYENEVRRLRKELEEKNRTIIDKTKVMQLEEEKRKMEEDKNNVMKALQERSKEFFRVRDEKKKLEEKIKAFNSQLIHGGGNVGQLERAFVQQNKLIKQYESKLKNLEQEKVKNGANIGLFEKQNEILMQLTAKINERDEVNLHLNEELCAYDRITKETEELLERRNQRIEVLEGLLKKNRIPIPKQQACSMLAKVEQKDDGVIYQGQMTYNITQGNMKKAEKQIKQLQEMNVNHKEEIKRLKNQLSSYERPKPPTPQKPPTKESMYNNSEELIAEIEEYKENQQRLLQELQSNADKIEKLTYEKKATLKPFKEAVDSIMKGLMRKENTDLKQIASEIFKLHKMVNVVYES